MRKPQIPVFTLLVLTAAMVKSDRRIILVGKEVFQNHFQESNADPCRSEESVGDNGERVSIVYAPGFREIMKKDMVNCVVLHSLPGPHAFLLVVNVKARSTSEEKAAVKWMEDNFGPGASVYSMLLFTHTDRLEGKSLDEYIRESEHLRRLKDLCGGRYHALSEQLEDGAQVGELLKKIEKVVRENGGKHYTNDLYEEARRKIEGLVHKIPMLHDLNKERVREKDKQKCKRYLKSKLQYFFDYIKWLLSWFIPERVLNILMYVPEFTQNCSPRCLYEVLKEMLTDFFN